MLPSLFPADLLILAGNAALASLVASGIALALSGRVVRGLPARHTLLAAALLASMGIPVLAPFLPAPQFPRTTNPVDAVTPEPVVPDRAAAVADSKTANALHLRPQTGRDTDGRRTAGLDESQSLVERNVTAVVPARTSLITDGPSGNWLLWLAQQALFIGPYLCTLWLAGTVWVALRMILALIRMRGWAQTLTLCSSPRLAELAREAARDVGLRRAVPVYHSARLPAPVAMGLLSPRIVVPPGFESGLPREQLLAILRHEFAHIARYDLWFGVLQQVAATVYWWNPLILRASRQLSEVREQICDDIAISGLPDPRDYATTLIQLAERCHSGLQWPATLGFGAAGAGPLERRIVRILSENAVRTRWLTVRAACGVTALITLMSSVMLMAQLPPGSPAPKSSPDAILPEAAASAQSPANPEPQTSTTTAVAPDAAVYVVEPENPWGSFQVVGRVIDPDGKPVAGATIYQRHFGLRPLVKQTVSDAAGQFTLSTPRRNPHYLDSTDPDTAEINRIRPSLIATAPGFGFGTAQPGEGVTIQMAADEPITGRVTDETGKPLAGARVRVRDVLWPRRSDDPVVRQEELYNGPSAIPVPAGEGLAPWLSAIQRAANINDFFVAHGFLVGLLEPNVLGDRPAFHAPLVPPVVTDEEGRFSLRGVGRERVAVIYIDGIPRAASTLIMAANRTLEKTAEIPDETPAVRKWLSHPDTNIAVFGNRIDIALAAGRILEGVVTDRVTGAPLAAQRVIGPTITRLEYSGYDRFFTTTDAEGRYRIESFPAGREADFKVEPSEDQPHFGREIEVAVQPGPGRQTVDFALTPCQWITGKVVDDVTGEGLESCTIEYFPFQSNAALQQDLAAGIFPEFDGDLRTNEDGSFRLRAYPGRGIIMACGFNRYLEGIGADTIPGLKREEMNQTVYGLSGSHPYIRSTTIEVNPATDPETYTCELRLKKGKSRKATVVDAEGVAVSGIEASGLGNQVENPITQVGNSTLDISNLYPGENRLIVARSVPRQLMGMATVKADEDGPVTVVLRPWANLTGRLVDNAGQPRWRGLRIRLDDGRLPIHTLNGLQYDKQEFLIDEAGRFQIQGLVPGAEYQLKVLEGSFLMLGSATEKLTLAVGESRDLGDIQVIPPAKTP